MALGIRGANPIWFEVDLQGNSFDDTFYLYVLENTIPYIPATIYHDPDLNIPWTNPIRFLANGTLPVDIYYEEGKVYRLEYRQHIGAGMPTQQDPLIYEVNNYVPGSGGSTPVDSVALVSSNQITNPQFALMSLENPVTIAGTNPDPIEVAPGWTLSLAGTGSVTISKVPLNNANENPSNAPYALRLTMNGWTTDSVVLRQRFEQNGMLWANKIVSSAVTARLQGVPQAISANLVDSNNSVLGIVLPLTNINSDWNEFTGYADLTDSTNPNEPPAAYIDYLLNLPSNIDIYLTSLQLAVQDLPVQPSFEQDSINRQIDHTYNRAYPIVPIGGILDFGGFVVPAHYYLCDGSAKSRVRDYALFNVITMIETITFTQSVNTFTTATNVNYHIGQAIESANIPAGTTVAGISGTTITMSANATITGPAPLRLFAWSAGDGSTTFNVPDFLGFARAGANGQLFYTSSPGDVVNGIGLSGGEAKHTLTIPEIPAHQHATWSNAGGGSQENAGTPGRNSPNNAGTSGATGGSQAHNNIPPTKLVKPCIRYQ